MPKFSLTFFKKEEIRVGGGVGVKRRRQVVDEIALVECWQLKWGCE